MHQPPWQQLTFYPGLSATLKNFWFGQILKKYSSFEHRAYIIEYWPVCPLFCACVRLELLLFNQYRQNLLTIFVSHESWPNFLLCYFCFQFQSHQKLANFATFTTQFCKQFQNDNSVTNMALKLKQKRLSGQCHLNFKVSFQLSHKFIKNSVKEIIEFSSW